MATNNSANMYIAVGAAQQITMPVQPTFYVSVFNFQSNVTGDGSVYTCAFDHEYVDQGGDFAANTFVAPVTGVFLLSTVLFLANVNGSHTKLVLSIVTTSNTYSKEINAGTCRQPADELLSISNTALCPMTAGDTAIVQITVSNSTKVVDVAGDNRIFYQNAAFYGSLIV